MLKISYDIKGVIENIMAYSSSKNKKINTQYFQELAESYKKSIQTNDVVDIITFVEAKWGLNMVMFPVQKFILKAFYGLELDNTEKTIVVPDETNSTIIGTYTEAEFMQYLIDTGRTNLQKYEPGKEKQNLVLNAGRRASKSTITSFISNYETYKLIKKINPQKYYGMPDGGEISVCVTAPTIETATTLFTTIKNNTQSCNYLKDRIVNRSSTTFTIATDHDRENGIDATIKLVCGGAGSADIRGRSNIVVIMDEAAFFNASGANSGEALYRALYPSVVSFTPKDEHKQVTGPGEGKTVLISSPFGKSGIFYTMYMDSFKDTKNTLMFSMYTTMLNRTVDTDVLKNEKRRNPQMFECEFCAKFSDTATSWVTEDTLNKITDEKLPVNPKHGRFGFEYYMGVDYAGKNDGSAITIVHKEGEKIVLDYSDVFYCEPSDIWKDGHPKYYDNVNRKFSECEIMPIEGFAEEIKRLCDQFPVTYGWFDQNNGYGLLEQLKKLGLNQFETRQITPSLNTQMYNMVEEYLYSEMIVIPKHPILIPELLNMEKIISGPKVSIAAPSKAGFHDDMTDSFVEACFACYEYTCLRKKSYAKSLGVLGDNSKNASLVYRQYRMNKARLHGIQEKRGL